MKGTGAEGVSLPRVCYTATASKLAPGVTSKGRIGMVRMNSLTKNGCPIILFQDIARSAVFSPSATTLHDNAACHLSKTHTHLFDLGSFR